MKIKYINACSLLICCYIINNSNLVASNSNSIAHDLVGQEFSKVWQGMHLCCTKHLLGWLHEARRIHFQDGSQVEEHPWLLARSLSSSPMGSPQSYLGSLTGLRVIRRVHEAWTEVGRPFFFRVSLPLHSTDEACHKSQHRFKGRTAKPHRSLHGVAKTCGHPESATRDAFDIISTALCELSRSVELLLNQVQDAR